MKDNFSTQADQYVKFRPTYPSELYDILLSLVEQEDLAWDCGTGNGQVAVELSKYFNKVYATDISEKQIQNAVKQSNIFYKVESAEQTSFADKSFDLVTVAQAIHWFDFAKFYKEVARVTKPGGILAVMGYDLIQVDPETDKIIEKLYKGIVGPYWDYERKYVDEHYKTIPFPFKEIEMTTLYNNFDWTLEQLKGFFNTWSAVQHFIKDKGQNPVELIDENLEQIWKDGLTKPVRFPILLRVARL